VNGALKTEKEERERELGAKRESEQSATVPHLNVNSRLSEPFSLKRDERERKK